MAHEPVLDPASAAPVLSAEKLDCYRVALEFDRLVSRLVPRRGRTLLIRIVQMLSKLIARHTVQAPPGP